MKEINGPRKLYIETYGCQMNVADSEVVAAVMATAGYETADSVDEADAVLLNTCSIRDNAEQKIFGRLQALNALRRRRGGHLIIGVIGCMAERVREELISSMRSISWRAPMPISICPLCSELPRRAMRRSMSS